MDLRGFSRALKGKSLMPRIYDLVAIGRLKQLLRQYSEVFNIPVFLFKENKKLLLSFPENAPEQELLIEPLFVRGSLVGHAAVPSTEPQSLDFIVKNLSVILEKGYEIESLSAEVVRNYEEFSILWRLSSKLGSVLDVEKVCTIGTDEIMNICPSKAIIIMLVDSISSDIVDVSCFQQPQFPTSNPSEKKQILFPKVALGAYADRALQMTLNTDRGLVGYVFNKKEALTVCDVHIDKRFEGFPYPVTRLLIVPLIVEDSTIGVIIASDKLNGEEFYSTEIKIISSIASECAISIKKASLFNEIRSILFSTAEAFSFAIDAKDPYTYGHSKRVSELAAKIAQQMGIVDDIVDWIRLSALLHDIGKIGTPENILHKSEKLDTDEMSKLKEHSLIGSRVIERIKKLSEMAKWIYHHHEKYDGSGYPAGIAGDTIPLPSRIISIADTFDALISDRPYRKSFTMEEAIKIMRKSIGEHFDPVLFEYFEKAIDVQSPHYNGQ